MSLKLPNKPISGVAIDAQWGRDGVDAINARTIRPSVDIYAEHSEAGTILRLATRPRPEPVYCFNAQVATSNLSVGGGYLNFGAVDSSLYVCEPAFVHERGSSKVQITKPGMYLLLFRASLSCDISGAASPSSSAVVTFQIFTKADTPLLCAARAQIAPYPYCTLDLYENCQMHCVLDQSGVPLTLTDGELQIRAVYSWYCYANTKPPILAILTTESNLTIVGPFLDPARML